MLPDVDVRAVLLPMMNPEDLDGGPVMGVRIGAREFEVDMGPDRREVTLWIGLFGMFGQSPDFDLTRDERLAFEIAENDKLDKIIEDTIGFWTPSGPMTSKIVADHRFTAIEQTQTIDALQYIEFGIWTAPILVTYFDMKDE